MVMKEGRMPLAKLVGDKKHEKCLGQISQALNEMLQSHDYPEDVQKIVTAHMREWVREWREKGVGKKKHSFEEFNNSALGGFGGGLSQLGIAQMNAIRRRNAKDGKPIPPGKS